MPSHPDPQVRPAIASPFAYGGAGRYLVTTDDRVVWITCLEDNTSCSYEEDDTVAGVRNTPMGILVVDVRGRATLVDVEDGQFTPLAECDVPATGLVTGGQDVWAVLHRGGVCVGRSDQIVDRFEVSGATCAAFDELGTLLCVGTQDGEALTFDLETKRRHKASVKEPVTGLSWSRLGWWLITTPHQLLRAERDLSRSQRLQAPEARASGGVVSPDGSLCAYRHGKHEVIVFGLNEGGVARAYYPHRTVGEIEFGPFPWLAIGIGEGDCNRVSLVKYAIQCAPDNPDRPRKVWEFDWELNKDLIYKERQRLIATGALRPEDEILPQADPVEEEGEEDWEEGHADHEEELVEDGSGPIHPSSYLDAQQSAAPFTLAPGEGIILQGGFGGKWGWGWLGVLLSVSVLAFGVPLVRHLIPGGPPATPLGLVLIAGLFLVTFAAAFWPVLRSGTYWLTTHRLHWKPRLGEAVTVSVDGIDRNGGSAHATTSSLTLGGRRPIALSYIGGMEQLWGGLLLLNELGEIDLSEEHDELTDVGWYPAKATDGLLVSQQGVIVLRPGYMAFLPTREPRHLIKAFFTYLVKAGLGKLTGVELPEANPHVPFDRFIPVLLRSRPEEFDDIIRETAERFGSVLWDEGDADITQEGLLLRGDRQALTFRQGVTKVSGVPQMDQLPFIESQLPEWTGGLPVPRRQPILRGLGLAVGFTIPALLFAWGGIGMSKAARLDLGEVSPAQALDPGKVPALAYVTISGRPDLKHPPCPVGRSLKKEKEQEPGSLVVALEEQPGLLLYVQKNHPLNQALQPFRSGDKKALSPGELKSLRQAWTVEGRISNGGQSAAPFLNLHWATISKYAVSELGAKGEGEIRVLAVGMKASSMAGNAWLAWGVAGILGLPASVLWLLTLRMAVRLRGC